MEEITLTSKKRVRDDSEDSESCSPEVKRLRDDLLGGLDESDLCATSTDLDLFMRSFEEEISASPSPASVVDLTSGSGEVDGESQPDLGFLLGASDDELGLPPSKSPEVERERASTALSELWRFDDEIQSYDSFEYGHGYEYNDNGQYLTFDYSDSGLDFDDAPLPLWRQETMPSQ